jgi:cholesterol oxidase
MGVVSAADGQVEGCPGLYVMDAAAFPTPVGVNPSATIAAIAEYKIERFIRTATGASGWIAPEMERARSWADARREQLDPIAFLATGESEPPKHAPIGIRFREAMKGFHADPAPGEAHGVREFRVDELRGIASSGAIETRLTVDIPNLAHFLALHAEDGRPRASLRGDVTLDGMPGLDARPLALCHACGEQNYLELFSQPPHAGSDRNLRYRLHFHVGDEPWFLDGLKFIRDDEGFDVWEDTSRLFFEISRGRPPAAVRRGILRLPAAEFFGLQLPSFEATNTLDPARRSWALAAFGRFFFGNLVEVYVPELDRVVDLMKRIVERTHA